MKVIGLSVDGLTDHQGWSADIKETQGTALNFPLLADGDKKVSDLYNPKDKKTQEASSKEAEREISKTKRVQASTPVGGGKGTAEPIDQEQLVTESRKGSMEAIYKRLQASGN